MLLAKETLTVRVYDFLKSIAAQLGDDRPGAPFRRYPLSLLATFYSEALCFVAANKPDLMTDLIVVKLQTGVYQDAAKCCGCINVLAALAQVDADGNIIKDLTSTGGTANDVSKWFRSTCSASSTGGTIIISISIEPGMNGVFTVDPPIPPGEAVYVLLKCVHNPPCLDEAAILNGADMGACTFQAALRSYILYRALQGDRHAVGASTEAQNEYRNALQYLGLVVKAEKAQESE